MTDTRKADTMSGKNRHTKRSRAQLTTQQLIEFHCRKATFDHARTNFLMVEESYYRWLRAVRNEYKIKTAKFNIDGKTGELTPVVEKPIKAV